MKFNDLLSSFVNTTKIDYDSTKNYITYLGEMNNSQNAIIKIQKTLIKENQQLKEINFHKDLDLKFVNDIFKNYSNEDFYVETVYPASTNDITKYSQHEEVQILETPFMYQNIVLPYINNLPSTHFSWIYNILDHITEEENRILDFENGLNGFMVMKDYKHKCKEPGDFYLNILAKNRSIKSIRDLTANELPLLQESLTKGLQVSEQIFHIDKPYLRFFIHYHPTFYHFHIHVVHTSIITRGIGIGRANLLTDVIDNLKDNSDYYKKKVMTATIIPDSNLGQSLLKECK